MFRWGFPLQRLAQLGSSRFQIGFARHAVRMLQASELVAFDATPTGLSMRAQNEDALARPVAQLRDLYGGELVLHPPQVRYISLSDRPYEPIMLLRVRTGPGHLDAVHSDLAARHAVLLDEHRSPSVSVLRAEAPLSKLLGYGHALSELTGGTSQYWIWLDRYDPMSDPPGGRAA
jgi:hypothetical protein